MESNQEPDLLTGMLDNVLYEEEIPSASHEIETTSDKEMQDQYEEQTNENIANGTISHTSSDDDSDDDDSDVDVGNSDSNSNSNDSIINEVEGITEEPVESPTMNTIEVITSDKGDVLHTEIIDPTNSVAKSKEPGNSAQIQTKPSALILSTAPMVQAKTSQNQIVYVKLMPNSATTQTAGSLSITTAPSSIKATAETSSLISMIKSTSVIINPTVALTQVSALGTAPNVKYNLSRAKSSPILLTTPTTATTTTATIVDMSTVKSATETVERTVNLLNNNKILIKSVKSTIKTSPVRSTFTINDGDDAKICNTLGNNGNANGTVAILDKVNTETNSEHTATLNAKTIIADKPPDSTTVVKPKIKREFEQLQKTVNESKVLMEYVIERKARGRRAKISLKTKPLTVDVDEMESNTSRSSSLRGLSRSRSTSRNESPMEGARSISKESDRSISGGGNRNMRSQNLEFSVKHRTFLQNIQKQQQDGSNGDSEDADDFEDECFETNENYLENSFPRYKCSPENAPNKLLKNIEPKTILKDGYDKYCWRCHQKESLVPCSTCIRSYHANCVKLKQTALQDFDSWTCAECVTLKQADEYQSNRKFEFDLLKVMLGFALNRALMVNGSKQFQPKVETDALPDYADMIINPICIDEIQENLDNGKYTTTEAFANEFKWILHNTTIYFSQNYKLMSAAKNLLKVCKQEMYDIETCHECYLNANTEKENWFVEVCTKPHLVLWAKLKGFPYWPAKAMAYSIDKGVDVRFFGDHDRAFVPVKDCFLYSQSDPNPPTNKQKRNTIADCVKEVDIYIQKLSDKFGSFGYADFKTPYNPNTEVHHLSAMIPGLRDGAFRRKANSSVNKSDLTLKIVKSADNHLSVVNVTPLADDSSDAKKLQDSLPPPSKRKTLEYKSMQRSKSTNKAVNKINTPSTEEDALPYNKFYVRRSSMIAERSDPKKVHSVILRKRKSMHANNYNLDLNDTDDRPLNKRNKSLSSNTIVASVKKSSNSKAGASHTNDQANGPVILDVDMSDESDTKIKLVDNDSMEKTDVSAGVRSVKSTRSTTRRQKSMYAEIAPGEDIEKTGEEKNIDTNTTTSTESALKAKRSERLSRCHKDKEINLCDSNDEKTDRMELSEENATNNNTNTDMRLRLRPFIEIKQEKLDENELIDPPKTTDENVSLKSASVDNNPISGTASHKETLENHSKPETADTIPSVIKTEIDSDDDIQINVSDGLSGDQSFDITSAASEKNPQLSDSISHLMSNIKSGKISVCDINKMTNSSNDKSDVQPPVTLSRITNKSARNRITNLTNSLNGEQRARKSFPGSSSLQSLLPNNVSNGSNRNATIRAPNNMVYIPRSSSVNLSDTLKSINPPPLAVVRGAGSQNNTTPTTVNSNSSSAASTPPGYSSGPPPLSIPSLSSTTRRISRQISQNNTPSHMLSGIVTENLASAVTDILVRSPPKLTSRPSAPMRSEGDFLFPTEAGNVSKLLMDNAHKMTDFFRSVIEDTLSDMASNANLEARTKLLELEIEKLNHSHNKEIIELKTNTDKLLCEMRISMEKERARMINEVRKQCELERIRMIEETKKRQWCTNCGKEAQLYCCWNTAYCDYPCQQQHWTRHMASCAQAEGGGGGGVHLSHQSKSLHGTLPHHASQQQQQQKQKPQQKKEIAQINVNLSKALVRNPTTNVPQRTILPRTFLQRMGTTLSNQSQSQQAQPCYAINVLQRQTDWPPKVSIANAASNVIINAINATKQITTAGVNYNAQKIYTAVPTLTGSNTIIATVNKPIQK